MASLSLVLEVLARDRASDTLDKIGGSADKSGRKLTALAAGVGGAVGGLLGGAFAAGLSGVRDFGAGAVDAFARVEDATGAASQVFGDQAVPAITDFADKAAQAFGISKGAALDASLTFGTLGKAAGLSGTDLAGFAQKFTGLAGDMASFRGTSPEQAVEAIGAALRGEAEPIRAYGVLLDDASLRQEALAQGLIRTTKDALTPQQKALAAAALITKQTSDAQGDFAKTSDSTANTQKRLAAEIENAQAILGAKMAPAVTAVRESFLGLIQGMSGAIDFVTGTAIPAVQDFARSVGDNAKTITIVAGVITAVFLPHLAALAAAATVSAVRVVAAWVAKSAAAIASAAVHSAQIVAMIARFVALGVAAAASAVRVVAGWVLQGAAAVASGVVMVAQVALMVGRFAFLGVQALLHAAKVAAAWLIALGPIGLLIAAVVGLTVVIIANWDRIKTAVKAGADAVVSFMKALPGRITSALGDFGSLLYDAGGDLLRGLARGITGAVGAVVDAAKDAARAAVNAVKGALGISSPSRVFATLGSQAGAGLILGLEGSQSGVAAAARSLAGTASVSASVGATVGDGSGVDMSGGSVLGELRALRGSVDAIPRQLQLAARAGY